MASAFSLWPAAAGAGLGAIAGSFLATVALRWPAGRPIARGRSRCDGCGRTLPPHALVPLGSWLWLGGRCAACRAPIDLRHPAMEAAAALVGAAALGLAPGSAGIAGALFGWTLLLLALLDLDHHWLPDRLTLPLLAGGLACGALGLPPALLDRAIGAIVGWASLALVAAAYARVRGRIGLGGGDPKLFAAIGAWLGWAALPGVLLGAALAGLGWAGLRALAGRRPRATDRLPFGTLLAAAAFAGWLIAARG